MSNAYDKGPVSDHFDGDRFYNEDSRAADKSLADVLRWSLKLKAAAWPGHVSSGNGLKPATSPARAGACQAVPAWLPQDRPIQPVR